MDTTTAVLEHIYEEGTLSLQSDYARQFDVEIATLASLGLISNQCGVASFDRRWRATAKGINALYEMDIL